MRHASYVYLIDGQWELTEGFQLNGNMAAFVFQKDGSGYHVGNGLTYLASLVGLLLLENSLPIPSLGQEAQPWAPVHRC